MAVLAAPRNPRRLRRVSRPMVLKRVILGIAGVAVVALAFTPSRAFASCALGPDVKTAALSAEIVFVGTVTATNNRDTWATVSVEEIWRGPDQPAELTVKGGPAGNAATSVDRTFEVGVKYLFFPYVDPASGLSDNSCTSTMPWTEELAVFRPQVTRTPDGAPSAATGFDFSGILGPIAVAVVVAGVLLGIGLLARSRQAS